MKYFLITLFIALIGFFSTLLYSHSVQAKCSQSVSLIDSISTQSAYQRLQAGEKLAQPH